MKQQIPYKLVLCFLLIPFIALANTGVDAGKVTKEKTIKKSFNVSSNATLKVSNSFGNLNVITWDENRIEFDISIKVSGNNNEKVEERLEGIDVEFSSSSSMVEAITKIEKTKNNWWNWGKKMNLKMEIDYVIKIPMSNNVDLKNKFGTINLDKLEGAANIRCDHGKITTKELLSNTNDIKFNHTKNSYFEYIKQGNISTTHSDFTVAKVENLDLKADHTKSIIEVAENVDFKCSFGSLKIDNVNELDGKAQHLTARVGNLFKTANLNTSHGSLKISRIASKANSVDIKSQFTGITLGYDSSFNFNFKLDFQHGSLRDSEGFNFVNKDVDRHHKKYSGYHGSQNSGNTVSITTQHGSVSFKKQ
ncbi:DUF4097 family beta strand repeat-containing protein [Winogradskyella tangerina]|uniref:hypothetical protein n=1 Tax=Winogradskyella tangerina TaxID=2023240 RepID=UPI000DBE6FEE|nr:hypothetical protein [Winogradskyella tangerina]